MEPTKISTCLEEPPKQNPTSSAQVQSKHDNAEEEEGRLLSNKDSLQNGDKGQKGRCWRRRRCGKNGVVVAAVRVEHVGKPMLGITGVESVREFQGNTYVKGFTV